MKLLIFLNKNFGQSSFIHSPSDHPNFSFSSLPWLRKLNRILESARHIDIHVRVWDFYPKLSEVIVMPVNIILNPKILKNAHGLFFKQRSLLRIWKIYSIFMLNLEDGFNINTLKTLFDLLQSLCNFHKIVINLPPPRLLAPTVLILVVINNLPVDRGKQLSVVAQLFYLVRLRFVLFERMEFKVLLPAHVVLDEIVGLLESGFQLKNHLLVHQEVVTVVH